MGSDVFTKPGRPQVAKGLCARICPGDTGDMEILLNGQACPTRDGATLADLLREQGLAERRVAIEVNGEIVPRGRHAGHVLSPADRVEIVHALGGG